MNTLFHPHLNLPRLLMLALLSLLLTLAIQPVSAQFGSDGTTLNDFVLDSNGLAWFKQAPYPAKSLKPDPQLRFIADPGNDRGGNALHPDSHRYVEELIKEVIKMTGSHASYEIAWTTAPGLAGGYQLKVRTDRGNLDVSCVQIAMIRMKLGKQAAIQSLLTSLVTIL